MNDINIVSYYWNQDRLEWQDEPYKPGPAEFYREARDEALSLWSNGWITKWECRGILMALYKARYLTTVSLIPGRTFKHGV